MEIQMDRYKSQPDVDTTSEDFTDLTNDPNEWKRKLEIYREVSVDGMGKSGNREWIENQPFHEILRWYVAYHDAKKIETW